MALEQYLAWKEKEEARKAEEAKRAASRTSFENRELATQLGIREQIGGGFLFDNGVTYDPTSGGYSIGTSFGYDPTKNISRIGNIGYEGELDPRIAMQMKQEDYDAVSATLDEYMNKFGDYYSSHVENSGNYGIVTPFYSSKDSGADLTQYGSSTEHIDTILEQLKKDDPELYAQVSPFVGKRESDQQKSFTKLVYDRVAGNLEDPYTEAYSELLKGQFAGATAGFKSSRTDEDWNQIYQKQDQQKQMTAEINAVYQNPALQGYLRDKQIADIKAKYGQAAPQQAPQSPALSKQPYSVANQTPTVGPNGPMMTVMRNGQPYQISQAEHDRTIGASQPSSPSTPPAAETSGPEGLDWESLYNQLSSYITDLSKPKQSTTQREQIGSFAQYGPTAAYGPNKSSYTSTGSYSGKGA